MKPRFCLPLVLLALSSLQAAEPPEPKFQHVTLDAAIQIGYGVAVADVDGDKLPDILLADKNQFVWYRNPGPEKAADPSAWQKHLLTENLTPRDNVCLAAQDIDGDGKCEIAVGAEWNPGDTVNSGAVFYLIPPADRTQPWQPVRLHAEPTVHRMKWVRVFHSGSTGAVGTRHSRGPQDWILVVVPLHGRGNKNGEGAGVRVLSYLPPAILNSQAEQWERETISESMHMTHNLDRVGNGAKRGFLLAGREGISAVTPNLTSTGTQDWTSTMIVGESTGMPVAGVGEVRLGYVDEERPFLATIEPMHGNQLVIYSDWKLNPDRKELISDLPLSSLLPKRRQVITNQLADGHALAVADLINIDSGQVVVGWRGNGKEPTNYGIELFTPIGADHTQWRESLIDKEMACEDLVLADLNGDGKLDIVASGRATRNLKIYLNQTQSP